MKILILGDVMALSGRNAIKKNLYDIIDLNLKLKTIKNKAYKLSQIKKLNEKSNDNIFYKLE